MLAFFLPDIIRLAPKDLPAATGGNYNWHLLDDFKLAVQSDQDGVSDGAGAANNGAAPVQVSIDIKPGAMVNPIHLKSNGKIPVAVFSTLTFDATKIDRDTVKFAGAHPLPIGEGAEDINGDGLPDLVFHFPAQDINLAPGDGEAVLSGETGDGRRFIGQDRVRVF